MPDILLEVRDLQAGYGSGQAGALGSSQVLFDMQLSMRAGEVITLLGRNGMGKSTFVKCISGLLAPMAGEIHLGGKALHGQPAYVFGRSGLGLVPEGRQVFPTLTVRENLVATAHTRHAGATPWTLERVYSLFPRLRERAGQLAGKMSGGEQQMLAVGRALMTNPRLLVLDEATEGLAPLIRAEIWRCLQTLRSEGMSMIVIDKNLKPLLGLANHHYVMEKGRIAWSGTSEQLQSTPDVVARYLSI
jgi:branched-chain amino acid transport system ATP-binding protein